MGLDHSLVGVPGEPLTVSMWLTDDGETALFRTTREDGTVVIDRGLAQVRQGER
jgi:hypothetical protein